MRVVINQSNYLPWKGYFDLIHDADVFIFLDDVQYTYRDWRSRNRIKTRNGLLWLSIPVGNCADRLINEVPLPRGDWAARHWESIRHAYSAAPHFEKYAPLLSQLLAAAPGQTLSKFNQACISTIAVHCLGISQTRFIDSSVFNIRVAKQERILALLKAVGATTYLSGPAARDYLDPERFAAEGIALEWKDYAGYPDYPQLHPPFEPAVSIIDLLFSAGPASPDYIWGWRQGAQKPVTP